MGVIPTLNRELVMRGDPAARALVRVPDVRLLDLPERAVQFGTGGFLRGFVEYFIDKANSAGAFNGRIVAVSTTGSDRDSKLRAQDSLYTLAVQGVEDGAAIREYRIISSLSHSISAATRWSEVLDVAKNPDIVVVFSNTTEIGIVLDETDSLDLTPPASFPGKLAAFLYHRAVHFDFSMDKGVAVIPCELIEDNGDRLREIVMELSQRWDLGSRFIDWLTDAVSFCNTLVDRIVSGTPPADQLEDIAELLGYRDGMLTVCEPYRLFAIEPSGAKPEALSWAVSEEGVLLVDSVTPFRERKVRLLNGGHTILVSLALLMGHETVFDALHDEGIGHFLRLAMLDEIAPTLDVADAEAYALEVIDRFRNPFVEHALVGITLHGTAKMAVRVVPSIAAYGALMGHAPSCLAFGFAAYLVFMRGDLQNERRVSGKSVPPDDAGHVITAAWNSIRADDSVQAVGNLVESVCSDESLWGTDLRLVPHFVDEVASQVWAILQDGPRAALNERIKAQLDFPATAS